MWVKITLPVVVEGPEELAQLSFSFSGRHSLSSQICIFQHCPACLELLPPPLRHNNIAAGSLRGHMNKICKSYWSQRKKKKILLTAPHGAPTSLTWVCLLEANDCVQADPSEHRVNENDALAALHLLKLLATTLKGFIKPLTKER